MAKHTQQEVKDAVRVDGGQLRGHGVVTTPGGPRPADHVHTVSPDDMVQRDKTGIFTVTRRPQIDLAPTRQLLATGLYAFTPGGIRPKSMIHTVEPGQIVDLDELIFKRFDLRSGKFIAPPPLEVAPPHLPALGSGWITYAAYTENSANIIASMTTTWVVPPAPKRQDNQLIYIFNGLQDSPVTRILQPRASNGVCRPTAAATVGPSPAGSSIPVEMRSSLPS